MITIIILPKSWFKGHMLNCIYTCIYAFWFQDALHELCLHSSIHYVRRRMLHIFLSTCWFIDVPPILAKGREGPWGYMWLPTWYFAEVKRANYKNMHFRCIGITWGVGRLWGGRRRRGTWEKGQRGNLKSAHFDLYQSCWWNTFL